MNAIEIADKLHQEADQIIHDGGIDRILRSHGRVWYTGSYAINTMVWPDIDICMVLEPNPTSVKAFFEIGKKIAELNGVFSLEFMNCLRRHIGGLPKGLYWGVHLDRRTWPTPWKIDIWATNREVFAKNQAMMKRVHQALDEQMRGLIIEIKHSLLTSEGRTPARSGPHIYEAVLFKGLRTEKEIRTYLRQQRIEGI